MEARLEAEKAAKGNYLVFIIIIFENYFFKSLFHFLFKTKRFSYIEKLDSLSSKKTKIITIIILLFILF